MENKAKMVSKLRGKYATNIEYEYRGHTYWVEYANAMDYCITAPRIQHQIEQEKIDKRIEQERNRKPGEPASVGFDLLFKYFEDGDLSVFDDNN